jgi:hypothetical protein
MPILAQWSGGNEHQMQRNPSPDSTKSRWNQDGATLPHSTQKHSLIGPGTFALRGGVSIGRAVT